MKTNGIDYETKGEGSPIVFIHGFGLDKRIWNKQVEELSKSHKVITYDLRGFGESDLPQETYSHSKDLKKLLEHLEIETATIVGHSFGGDIAMEFAAKYPEKVSNMLLLSPALRDVHVENPEWEELTRLGKEGEIIALKERMERNRIFEKIEDKDLLKNVLNKYTGFHFTNKDPHEEKKPLIKNLSELDIPTKVIYGQQDPEAQKKTVKELAFKTNFSTKMLLDTGHMSFMERPERINAEIEKISKESTRETHSEISNYR